MGIVQQQLACLPAGEHTWRRIIEEITREKPDRSAELDASITAAYENGLVNPEPENLFRALALCPAERTKVIILGQDPYPDHAAAMGLAFSVTPGTKLPQSLKNIAAELTADVGFDAAGFTGSLEGWAAQGVLLLNASLSVEAGNSNSHKKLWGDFSLRLLKGLYTEREAPLAAILWGGDAAKVGRVLEKQPSPGKRLMLYSAHPSPLSAYRGFFGSHPFSAVNAFLRENGIEGIDWQKTTL